MHGSQFFPAPGGCAGHHIAGFGTLNTMWGWVKHKAGLVGALVLLCVAGPLIVIWLGIAKVAHWFGLDAYTFLLLFVATNASMDLITTVSDRGAAAAGPFAWIVGGLGTVVVVPLAAYVLAHWWGLLFRRQENVEA
ncbi:putative protein OS=Tsukamurella paurometabola (strain ATCC 8368 / DSM / CCUG 35730 /CIP 100753 / JCM 10117 / KCTC 9821 / NBRC 16120 / NCIMB 702349/ NCTC 13040) OX=521096 GN=Tpau_3047 PE=4 SV=1 [Tsukamurella paurometabola]|uniref:Uncharacterized protein n=1 Tax=Tsukamurella paurometabola (strain ATCC 8368 / DSM 20162 / CCUG 35730 / CIP 100753 / JCM 10117 / KCTC 9821 / NBRC 16120 / NCIMB 702349 / NCTC 13040) TaxID=521096 RepID=D5UUS2_TSUPD|nr:hypothetical protein Tpau_3047 [Tsukamurella paurometabola DSM 20162]SUP36562.1 Uncharacterised protein [Tsukamurella paurometabola]